jgi:hypothetical protein
MRKRVVISGIAIALLGSAAVLAQGQPQQPQKPMTFFIASTVAGHRQILAASRSGSDLSKPGAGCLEPVITPGMLI